LGQCGSKEVIIILSPELRCGGQVVGIVGLRAEGEEKQK
jgi:hypothetical protein